MDLVLFAEVAFGLSLVIALGLVARNSARARRLERERAVEAAARERELRRRMMAGLGSATPARPVRIPMGAGAAGADAARDLLGLRSHQAA